MFIPRVVLVALLALATGAASAQAPVRLFVGFPAGGTIDAVARMLAEQMKDDLGAPVVVESRPGAGGQIAAQAAAQAAPDGRTLLLSPDHTMVMLPLTVKSPGFQPLKDFAPVAQVASYLGGFAVSKDVKAHNLAEYFAWARANPAQANVGIPAPGSIPQFFVFSLAREVKAPLSSVPYRGSAPLVQDLLGGQIPAGTTALGDFVEHHQAGRMRVIAVLGERRSPLLPEIPTFVEQGYKIDWEYWLGLFAPAGTPPAAIERTNAAVKRALTQPEVRERMRRIVFEPTHSSPQALAEKIRQGQAYWEPVVRAAGWVLQ